MEYFGLWYSNEYHIDASGTDAGIFRDNLVKSVVAVQAVLRL